MAEYFLNFDFNTWLTIRLRIIKPIKIIMYMVVIFRISK